MAIRGLLLALMVLATAAKALSADANDLVRALQSGLYASCCLADAISAMRISKARNCSAPISARPVWT